MIFYSPFISFQSNHLLYIYKKKQYHKPKPFTNYYITSNPKERKGMISAGDLYAVLTAVVPLYVAMLLAYGSVRWWKIFTPDQCSGINRFVAVFAVPLLSFHFISSNDPYAMNFSFMAADTLQKIIVLTILSFWLKFSANGSLEWLISIFSLSTLPNTLVMGIPLLVAMYGKYAGALMVQVVVLQCIIWYTLLLFFFEYRGAMTLLLDQFPHTAASIASFEIDADVVSLDCHDILETETQFTPDGRLHVTLRKSNASRMSLSRPSNLTGMEIYSLSSSRNPTPRASLADHSDLYSTGGRLSNFTPGDVYSSLHCSRPQTPRLSSFEEGANHGRATKTDPGQRRSELQISMEYPRESVGQKGGGGGGGGGEKETVGGEGGVDVEEQKVGNNNNKGEVNYTARKMPPARVMTRLILIMVWRKLIRNPNTYSSLIGLLWSLISFRFHVGMPKIVAHSISILSDAGLGMAMFSLGLFMALQPKIIACGNVLTGYSMLIRFVMGPAVMSVASLAVGLRGTLLRIAIVQAALPQGIVPFVFAKEYNVHPAILSTAVIFGMLVALPITILYYFILEI